jgi:hypothetical protein
MKMNAAKVEAIPDYRRVRKVTTEDGEVYAVRTIRQPNQAEHRYATDLRLLFEHLELLQGFGVSVPEYRHVDTIGGRPSRLLDINHDRGWLVTNWVDSMQPSDVPVHNRLRLAAQAVKGTANYTLAAQQRQIGFSDIYSVNQWVLGSEKGTAPHVYLVDIDPVFADSRRPEFLQRLGSDAVSQAISFEEWLELPQYSLEDQVERTLALHQV